jgi:predicted RNase H-like nuclease (RuvC/YqgF family)
MKNPKKIIAISFLVIGTMLTSCFSTEEKKDKEIENISEINEDYKDEIKEYKIHVAEQIATNEKSIATFKSRIAQQKKEAKTDYEKKINDLNNKNTDLKKKLEDFKTENKESWESFKVEFGKDMDELGKAFHDFTVNSKK